MHYPTNRAPLADLALTPLPVGAIKPHGWLKDQMQIVADGSTGHLDEFWPSLSNSAWKGGDGDAWERGPYYLDGLVPLAYQLDDPRLIAKVKTWIEPILASGQENGWFGPRQNGDRWPLAVACKVLTQYHEATGDERALTLLENYFSFLAREEPDWPDTEWRGVRAIESITTAFWLYRRTGDAKYIKIADKIYKNSFDWTGYFHEFPYPAKISARGVKFGETVTMTNGQQAYFGHPSHVVNIAMGIKQPGVWFQRSGEDKHKTGSFVGIDTLDKYHGQVAGRFSGDEHLSGKSPAQGTELCAVVEYMWSLENLLTVFGDVALADRLEMLAYNAIPGATTPDYWTHQYDQQANQVMCSIARRAWSTNSDDSNLYGLEPNFGCCTANKHQGWPKFVAHMWMATPDNGLTAVALGPNTVTAKVGDGATVTIVQETDYPFDGKVRFTIKADAGMKFPLHVRIPSWAADAKLSVGAETFDAKPGTFAVADRTWKPGDVLTLALPMKLRTETRFNNSVSILRGPLYYSLRVGEHFNKLHAHHDTFPMIDWEVVPTTAWNYGLMIDRDDPAASIEVETKHVSNIPFHGDHPPVVLKANAKRLPGWTFFQNSAADPPESPVESDAPAKAVELIPYGNTRLRITEFPVAR